MSKVKYLGSYNGPSYFSYDRDYMMGLESIQEAKDTFKDFYDGSVGYKSMRENADGLYIVWEEASYTRTPGTSEEDCLDVYYAIPEGSYGGYRIGEYAFRLSFGPRRGIIKENA